MRVLIAGDTHCNLPWTLNLVDKAVEFDADRIVVLGDFGFWPQMPSGRDFLFKLNHQLMKNDIPLFWLDGNHEDHLELQKLVKSRNELVEIRDQIFYTPRGYLGHWDCLSFVTLGGAFSIDREYRVEGHTWFEEENITDKDVSHAVSHGSADILLSHEMPFGAPIALHGSHHLYDVDIYPEALENRSHVHDVAWRLKVKKIFHGHHHVMYRANMAVDGRMAKIEGLACDHENGAWTILDTDMPL